jgi:UDP-2,3-diacylglucosamine hydrolase
MTLALFAGTGDLPGLIAARMAARLTVVCQMAGFPAVVSGPAPVLTYRLEGLGPLLVRLRAMGVTKICMAGALRRPVIDPGQVDPVTAPLLARLEPALRLGDDGTLRAVIGLFEDQGFTVLAASDLLPDLLPPAGVLTLAQPGPLAEGEANLGALTVAQMGRDDSGQACVVAGGRVLAREGPAGTDAMLAGLMAGNSPLDWPLDLAADLVGQAADWLSGDQPAGLLYKAPKPGQDRRADLPVIGPATADGVIRGGLAGIVIQAGGVMVIDLPDVLSRLNRAGRFLWVRP